MKRFIWKNKNSTITLGSLIIIIICWGLIAKIINQTIVLPTPIQTLESLVNIVRSKDFVYITVYTIRRTIISFMGALVVGVILGMFAGINIYVELILRPLITILRTVPTMSVIILSLIWLGGEQAPILISFLVIFPIVYINVIKGIHSVDTNLLEMALIYNVPKILVLKKIYFSSVIPYLNAAINAALGLGFKVTVAAEVMGDTKFSIGKKLQLARFNLDMPTVFAWAIILITIVTIFDAITNQMTKLLKKV
jgi:NitT/TauT family transport system permease protein